MSLITDKLTGSGKILLLAGLVSPAALADIELYQDDQSRLSLYGSFKPMLQYQKDTPAPYKDLELRDNASRLGLKGRHQLDELRLYGKLELGNHIDDHTDPLLYIRQSYMGARNELGRVQFGKQNALFKMLGRYDRSNALGGAARVASDELGTGRGRSLMAATRIKGVDLRAQYALSASLDSKPVLRAGSQRLSLDSRKQDDGVALYSRVNLLPALRARLAYQATEYQQQGRFYALGAELELKSDSKGANPWRLALLSAKYKLDDGQDAAEVSSVGLGGQLGIRDDARLYSSIDYLKGSNALDGGKELTYLLGGQYQYHSDLKLYSEIRLRTFDARRRDETRLALGGSYSF